MRSRKYDIKLQHSPKTIRVIVYADRSVEMGTVHHEKSGDVFIKRPEYLQTREEAAWSLSFDRHAYNVKREWL